MALATYQAEKAKINIATGCESNLKTTQLREQQAHLRDGPTAQNMPNRYSSCRKQHHTRSERRPVSWSYPRRHPVLRYFAASAGQHQRGRYEPTDCLS